VFAVGVDAGNAPRVRVMDPATGELKTTLQPFNSAFRGGVRVATGDLTGDGVPDIVAAAGPGSKATVKVYDGVTFQQLASFEAYESFKGGVFVAVGDVSGDGRADLITGPGDGGGAHVKVFDGAGLFPANPEAVILPVPGPNAFVYREFFAYDAAYRVGARVAAGDVDGDGRADVVTATGPHGGPHVRVFSAADGSVMREWMAYDALFSGGVFIAAGDVTGDGKADVVTGMGANGIGEVKAFDGRTGRLIRSFVPNGSIVRASARVGVFDYDNDGDNDVVVSVLNKLSAYDGRTYTRTGGMTVFDAAYTGGVFFG
jgi:serralysin